jgi:hypothetical protein
MEASQKTKLPLLHKLGYTPTKGTLGNCLRNTIRLMPDDHTSLSLDASLVIPTCVLRFEASHRSATPNRSDRFPKPVRPVLARQPRLVFGLDFVAQWVTQWFSGEPLQTPRTWCSQSPLMTRLPQSPGSTLVLRLNQETVHRLHLVVLATMRPALDSASHRVPRTKSTCLLHLTTFRTCSSPTPTTVKPQPRPAILS